MTRLYLRKARVTLSGAGGGVVIGERPADPMKEPLKIQFSCDATISGSPNTATIDIWNLAAGTRNSVGKEFDQIQLDAGYTETLYGQGNVSTIFKGYIRDVEHRRESVDIITHIECGDGDKAIREGVVAETMDEGTTPKQMVEKLYEQMEGVDRGDMLGLDDLPAYKRPVTLYGPVAREMNKLGRSHGFYWSIQNGVLETIPADGFLPQEFLISPRTGMIGVPTITDSGIKVSALLNPQIRPNRVIIVESETLEMNTGQASARYRVDRASFGGDNRDGEFRVDIEGTKISGGKATG